VVHHWYQYNEYVLQDKLAQQVHHTDGTKKINLSKEKKSVFLFTYRSNTIHQDFSSSTHINQWLLIGDICNNGIDIGTQIFNTYRRCELDRYSSLLSDSLDTCDNRSLLKNLF
jgi:hypothetical protein